MASITTRPDGSRFIQFTLDKQRRTIHLGTMTEKKARCLADRVENLVSAKKWGGQLDDDTTGWLAKLPDNLYAKLADVELVKPRAGGRAVLGAFVDAYLADKPDMKEHTRLNWLQVRQWLVLHFGASCDMRSVTPADAEDWRAFMVRGGPAVKPEALSVEAVKADAKRKRKLKALGENSIRRHIGRARQLWRLAIRRGLVRGLNPFEGMVTKVGSDKARQFFVTRDMADAVLEACPDAQWRLLFALSRFGGLRCPSEHLALKWGDIDFDKGRIRVPSPKTEHLEGKESRIIPMFPELRKPLLEAYTEATEGSQYVIWRYRDKNVNLRKGLVTIIGRAGLKVWPKPWHNLRASRQTELAEKYPIHVVCQWIGNSEAIAQAHYLQVTDAHFANALGEADENALQNAQQYGAESSSIEPEMVGAGKQKSPELPGDSASYNTVQEFDIPPRGVEPRSSG